MGLRITVRETVADSVAESSTTVSKLSNDHIVLSRLAALTEITTDDKEWYAPVESESVMEQALTAQQVRSGRTGHQRHLCSLQTSGRSMLRHPAPEDESGLPATSCTASGYLDAW